MLAEIELDLADYLKDYTEVDFVYLADYMDDYMQPFRYSRTVPLQQVMDASDDSTYKSDRVTIDGDFHSHELASLPHTDLMILNAANSAAIADNSCCPVQVVALAHSLNEVNKAGCMMVNCNRMMSPVGVVEVEFDCAEDLPHTVTYEHCSESHICFDYCAYVMMMVADNEMKSLAERSDVVLAMMRELNKHMSLKYVNKNREKDK